MEVEVRYYTALRDITGNRFERVSLKPNSSVKDLINYLVKKYGEKFDSYIYNSNQSLTRNLSLIFATEPPMQVRGQSQLEPEGIQNRETISGDTSLAQTAGMGANMTSFNCPTKNVSWGPIPTNRSGGRARPNCTRRDKAVLHSSLSPFISN